MSILNRISTILRANVNDLLDRSEDPEKLLTQILRDLGEAIRETRGQVAEAVAQGKLVEGDMRQAQQLATEWQRKAALAANRGADDLARECLRRKRDYSANAQVLEQQVIANQSVITRLKSDLNLLEAKYTETQRNREMLLTRYRASRAQQRIHQAIGNVSVYDPSGALKRMEERIRLQEARAAAAGELAVGSLESRMASLAASEGDLEIEAELLELKEAPDRPRLPSPEPAPER
jgi:phage shock protein A